MKTFFDEIAGHYRSVWGDSSEIKRWDQGPTPVLSPSFRVLEFWPTERRKCWTYATCCMSSVSDEIRLELHMFSPVQHDGLVELLTAVAHYHRSGNPLWLHHTVNFGRPWLGESLCDHGLISLPYLDGPRLENFRTRTGDESVRFLWLLPITKPELLYKISEGVEELEARFDAMNFNYLDPNRSSVL